ncbi:hypothetical protein FGW37_31035 [Streptomyces rectiverticillatus]|uniref:hypothetical protein n=1 Tax=Streptomyces rectiverticillatus TaxID=173860 RepID=UPI0015C38215|nr:hypothetical protein [Streptomyces rectiverticillatus]QLE75431.1 hypothetical protein FGW37_31035 [Streptomyces rectiverticillatus]
MADHPDPLVVPVDVEALVMSETVGQELFYSAPLLFAPRSDPGQVPFKTHQKQLGVYVHWQLPDALMAARAHAKDGTATTPVHPVAPNRWLVIRYFRPDSDRDSAPKAAGWVIESDFASTRRTKPGQKGGTSPFGPGLYIGRRHDLAGGPWAEDPHADRVRLTAAGPGIPEFAAYQPYNADVFSMHDRVGTDRKDTLPNGTLDYLVFGWHNNPQDDPLHQKQAADLLEFFYGSHDPCTAAWQQLTEPRDRYAETLKLLRWRAPDGPVPQRSVYTGAVLGLRWGLKAAPVSRRPAGGAEVKLAIGHGPADATAALVRDSVRKEGPGNESRAADDVSSDRWEGRKLDEAVLLMNAFQSGELEALDGDMTLGARALDEAEHRTWFHSTCGGYAWQIVPPPGDGHGGPTSRERQALEKLNQCQETLDRAERRQAALRGHLYDLWWMGGLQDPPEAFAAACKQQLDIGRKDSLAQRTRDAALAVAAARKSVEDILRKDEKDKDRLVWLRRGWAARRVPRPPFFEAAEPVLLLHGAAMEKDTPPTADAWLPCRMPAQLIPKITVNNREASPQPAPEPPDFAKLKQALDSPSVRIPFSVLLRVLTEFWTISRTLAAFGTSPPQRPLDREARALPAVMKEHRATIPAGTQWPALSHVWQQPWRPLHLHWQVDFYPQPHDKDYWALEGVHHHQRPGTRKPVKLQEPARGRTLLASVPLFTWHRRVQDHRETHPTAPHEQLKKVNGHVAGWDLLTQALDGLHAWSAQRRPGLTGDPLPAELKDLLRPHNAVVPDADAAHFQPVRAGQFVLSRLAVSDRFGHALDVIAGEGQKPEQTPPRRSPGLTPRHPVEGGRRPPYVQQPPRLVQPARLAFDFMPHRSTEPKPVLDLYTDPDLTRDTPVCGWLLAHRDPHTAAPHSLLVHDPHGKGLGEVRLIGPVREPKRQAVTWLPLPGSPWLTPGDVFGERFGTAYPHLAGFLRALVDQDADQRAGRAEPEERAKPRRFREVMAAVDRGLHSIAPPVADRDRTLCVLAGRPLALVRTRIHLEVYGPPPDDVLRDDWKAALKRPAPGDQHPLWSAAWPVPLGAAWDRLDGLIGYYTAVDGKPRTVPSYERLYVAHEPPKSAAWLTWIEKGPLTLAARPAPVTVRDEADPSAAAYPVLLMDPFAKISARTGILPTAELRLPPALVSAILSHLRIGIPAGPLLLTGRPAPPERREAGPLPVVLPAPTGWLGTWDWYERTDPADRPRDDWTRRPLVPADARVSYGDTPPVATSGYLTHTPPLPSKPPSGDRQEIRP